MRKSKYLGMKSGEWVCSHVGVARVQPAYKLKKNSCGQRVRSKYPGHQTYYYIFERRTSDNLADKMVRLSAAQVRMVSLGFKTVEKIADQKKSKNSRVFTEKVSYSYRSVC